VKNTSAEKLDFTESALGTLVYVFLFGLGVLAIKEIFGCD
jgi:hypothetical protein